MIRTKTLKFWKLNKHPFRDDALDEHTMGLFVGRQKALDDLIDAVAHSKLIGIYGTLGAGKSSFLRRLRKELAAEKLANGYVHYSADSENTLFRELLAEVLFLYHKKTLKLKKGTDISIKDELLRMNATVAVAKGANFGGKIKPLVGEIGGDFTEETTKTYAPHDEDSARSSVQILLESANQPVVLILDDFEKLRYETSGETRDYFSILSRFATTLEGFQGEHELVFIASMDDLVIEHVKATQKRKGHFAFSMNHLYELPHLPVDEIVDLIRARLKSVGYRMRISNFLTQEAFWALIIASGRNTRLVIKLMAEAMKHCANRGSDHLISIKDMKFAALDCKVTIDEKALTVATYLSEHKETSAYDDKLREAAQYAKPKGEHATNRQFERKLKEASELVGAEMMKDSGTNKISYKLKPLKWS